MTDCNQRLLRLRDYLSSLPVPYDFEGADGDNQLLGRLAECWECFDGHHLERMEARKLDRAEKVRWEPPELTFTIERHGGTVLGSTRGELQHWCIDVMQARVFVSTSGHRQLTPAAKPLKLEATADDVARVVRDGSDDERVRWDQQRTKATVNVSQALAQLERQEGNRSHSEQTRAGRAKRLQRMIDDRLRPVGWRHLGRNVFTRVDPADT